MGESDAACHICGDVQREASRAAYGHLITTRRASRASEVEAWENAETRVVI